MVEIFLVLTNNFELRYVCGNVVMNVMKKMKKRDRKVKQDVAVGQKLEPKGPRPIRGVKHGGSKSAPSSGMGPRERGKRSGVEAVKLHLQTTGFTGRTSRSATSVGIQ